MSSLGKRLALGGGAILLSGCVSWWPQTPGGGPGARVELPALTRAPTEGGELTRVEVQVRVQRFSDSFIEETWHHLDGLVAGESDLERRRQALELRYGYGWAAISIASGRDPAVSVLDMMVFLSLARIALEEYWVPQVFGPRGQPLLDSVRILELQFWGRAEALLDAGQREELRGLIRQWRQAHPHRHFVEAVRFGDFAANLESSARESASGLLDSVRYATATADEALELAERMTYFFGRVPILWRMHAQLAFLEIAGESDVRGLLRDVERISASADRLSRVVDGLGSAFLDPSSPDGERLAASLEEADIRARGLMSELRQTLEAGSELTRNMEALALRLDLGGGPEPTRPFEIRDYSSAAQDFAATAVELRVLVETLNELLASPTVAERLPSAVGAARSEGEELLEYGLLLAAVVAVSVVFSVLLGLLAYRYLARRLFDRETRTQG